ncbi:MAG: hypothetical protein AAB483_03985 [Patescibacteria group bacterium]
MSKFAIGFFIVAGVTLLVTPHAWWPKYYDVTYMGIAALVCAVAIWRVPARLKTPLAIILLLNASGDLGLYQLYKYGFEYDKVIHLASPLIATLALARFWNLRRAVIIVLVCGIAWELFEFLVDRYFKTRIFGVYHLFIWRDTILDMVLDGMGVAIAYLFLRLKSSRKSGTVS